jgi:N-acetyl-anhydromuramyl-L-alanine amidase AmpD
MPTSSGLVQTLSIALLLIAAAGCHSNQKSAAVGQQLPRKGDEIVVCGQYFHTGGAKVVLWTDPGGFDAYRTERRFSPYDKSSFAATTQENHMAEGTVTSPNRYSLRARNLTPEQIEEVRGGGWPLGLAQQKIDQFVYHFDVCGTSRQCFNILQDHRGLSVHFMLDVDGTIYQTLDVKERAWHATKANDRSVGIEIANIGCYRVRPPSDATTEESGAGVLNEWYRKGPDGKTRMVLPAWASASWIRTPNFIAHPARNDAIVGEIQGREYRMYDLTPQQYDALIKLTATLCTVLPRITPDYPRDANGKLVNHVLPSDQYEEYHGLLGHYHVQTEKQDPGPAFQWDKVTNGARALMGLKPLPTGDVINMPNTTMAKK